MFAKHWYQQWPGVAAGLGLFFTMAVGVGAQGVLLDERPDQEFRLPKPPHLWPPEPLPHPVPEQATYRLRELSVQATLDGPAARVQMSQTFQNTGNRPLETRFVFPLPYDGAIEQMTLMVDGKEYPAKLLPAEEARRIYQSYLQRQRDPALLELMAHGLYQTSIFPVPAGAERTVTLSYAQLCRVQDGATDFVLPLGTAKYSQQPLDKVSIDISMRSPDTIKNVYSPTHRVTIERPNPQQAVAHYRGTNEVPTTDFRLIFDADKQAVSARCLSYWPPGDDAGYFMLMATSGLPEARSEPLPKTVVFVLDRSGSMSGTKLDQAKEAVRFVLRNLRPVDRFNLVVYDNHVDLFRPELQRCDDATRQAALAYVDGIFAGGSTNIDGALIQCLDQLGQNPGPNYVLFLTDGLPTAGETGEAQITAHARSHNQCRARILTLGVGYDVNSRLLDRITIANYGQSHYVRPNEDLELVTGQVYRRIDSPVLMDAKFTFASNGQPAADQDFNRIYPRDVTDLFSGQPCVILGRYRRAGPATAILTGRVHDAVHTTEYPIQLQSEQAGELWSFIPKLWAMRRVGEIIDELDLSGKNQELINELTALATRHGILTAYTSYLATDLPVATDELARERVGKAVSDLLRVEGRYAFEQRDRKAGLKLAEQVVDAVGAPAFATADGAGNVVAGDPERPVAPVRIQTIGARTFYRQKGEWLDAHLSQDQIGQAVVIDKLGDRAWELLSRGGREAGQVLALEGDVIVRWGDQVYRLK